MNDPIVEIRELICEIVTFCYSKEHSESLRSKAAGDGLTLEQMVAAAIAHRISEEFEVRRKALN